MSGVCYVFLQMQLLILRGRFLRRIAISAVYAGLFLQGPPAFAGELKKIGETHNYSAPGGFTLTLTEYEYTGSVEVGDLSKIKKLAPKGWFQNPVRITLNNGGGNFAEAVAIGHYLWDSGIPTKIDAGGRCLSSCAIIFMSGSSRGGDGLHIRNRRLHIRGSLGFHAPYFDGRPLDRKLDLKPSAAAKEAFSAARESSQAFLKLQNRAAWPSTLVAELLAISNPKQYLFVDTVNDAGRWKIELDGVSEIVISQSKLPILCSNIAFWQSGERAPITVRGGGDTEWRSGLRLVDPREFTATKTEWGSTKYTFEGWGEMPGCEVDVPDDQAEYLSVKVGDQQKFYPMRWGAHLPGTALSSLGKP
jgi:hypothetical protein